MHGKLQTLSGNFRTRETDVDAPRLAFTISSAAGFTSDSTSVLSVSGSELTRSARCCSGALQKIGAQLQCVRLGSNVDYSDLVHKHMPQLKGYSRDYANWRKEQLEKATIGKWCVAVTTCIGSGHHILAK